MCIQLFASANNANYEQQSKGLSVGGNNPDNHNHKVAESEKLCKVKQSEQCIQCINCKYVVNKNRIIRPRLIAVISSWSTSLSMDKMLKSEIYMDTEFCQFFYHMLLCLITDYFFMNHKLQCLSQISQFYFNITIKNRCF